MAKLFSSMKALYHYKLGLIGYFAIEQDAEPIMNEIGGVFQWENPHFL